MISLISTAVQRTLFTYLQKLFPDRGNATTAYKVGSTVFDLSAHHESARHIAAMVLLLPTMLCYLFTVVFYALGLPRSGMGFFIVAIGFTCCTWFGHYNQQRATEAVLVWAVIAVFLMSHIIPQGELTYPYYFMIQLGALFVYGIRRLKGVIIFALLPIVLHTIAMFYTLPAYGAYFVEEAHIPMNFLTLSRFLIVTCVLCLVILLQQKSTLEIEAIVDKSIEATRIHQQQLNDIVTAIQEAIWLTDATGNIILSNPSLQQSLVNRFHIMFGNRFDMIEYFEPHERELWREQYQKVFRGETTSFTTEWQDKVHNRMHWWEITLLPLSDRGLIYGAVGVGREITEQKEFAERILALNQELSVMTHRLSSANENLESRIVERTADLAQLAKELQQENVEHRKTKKSLASSLEREKRYGDMRMKLAMMLSHQFRTPMAYIKSASDLMEAYLRRGKEIDEARLRNLLNSIDRGTSEMEKLMNDISNLLETQAELQQEQPQQFNLVSVVREALQLQISPGDYQDPLIGHSLLVDVDEDLIAFTRLHALRTALFEIIRNAVQYSEKGSTISITSSSVNSLETNEKIYSIAIHNTGSQIPIGEEHNIFEFFYRAGREHEVGASRSLGIGLGLAKYAVELLGGSVICVRGLLNEAKFTITFPQKLPTNLYDVPSVHITM